MQGSWSCLEVGAATVVGPVAFTPTSHLQGRCLTVATMAAPSTTFRTGNATLPPAHGEAYGARMRFQLLGPLEVEQRGDRLALGGPKQRLVLALLLIRATTRWCRPTG